MFGLNKNENKRFLIDDMDIKQLIEWNDPDACLVSNRILINGEKVGYMYRDEQENEVDSGWRIYSGTEPDEYLNDYENNLSYINLNTVCNYDNDIIPIINSPYCTAFRRDESGRFIEVPYEY